MKLYWLANENRYVHRMSDVPKGVVPETREIPTDLAGLMGHLNELHQELASLKDSAERSTEQFDRDVQDLQVEAESQADDAPKLQDKILRDCDIEDHIHNAPPARLAVLSAAVCWRIKELTNGCDRPAAVSGQAPEQGSDGEPLAEKERE